MVAKRSETAVDDALAASSLVANDLQMPQCRPSRLGARIATDTWVNTAGWLARPSAAQAGHSRQVSGRSAEHIVPHLDHLRGARQKKRLLQGAQAIISTVATELGRRQHVTVAGQTLHGSKRRRIICCLKAVTMTSTVMNAHGRSTDLQITQSSSPQPAASAVRTATDVDTRTSGLVARRLHIVNPCTFISAARVLAVPCAAASSSAASLPLSAPSSAPAGCIRRTAATICAFSSA